MLGKILYNHIILIVCFCKFILSAVDQNKLCAACHVVVNEIEYEISKVDPKKVLEIEGFRVDPRGNQKNKKIPYARSETHLTEVTESLCDRMNEYMQSEKDGRISYVPTKSRDGQPVQLENVSMSGDIAEKLRHMCNTIIEDHEESIIEYFKKSSENAAEEFCSKVTDICEEDEEEDVEEEGTKEEL